MSDNIKRTEISDLGEFGLIDHLLEHNVLRQRSTVKGPGDDAAVLDYGGRHLCVSTDLLIEGIHFDMMYTPLKHLGYKAVVVNLSDICAMNVVPTQVTVSLAVSSRYSVEALEELYEGIQAACKFYGVDLVGGDTTASPSGLVISVTAMGPVPQPDRLTYRDGARPGDVLCVTGDLGGAFLGLQILEREKQLYMEDPSITPDLEGQSYVVGRQLKPEARMDIVDVLKKTGLKPTSMIDVSDGLASDIFHITRSSKVGAVIFEEQVPIHNESKMLALKFNMDPITCALSGGEDYELMFTVRPNDLEKVRMLPDLYIIGEIVKPEHGVKLRTEGGNLKDIKAQGWAHFKG
jgi:thiamine-monophosphate kinase